ncbi:MAG TPA: DUF4118 domain-containing protein [Stellaceae bacterium]|nr:DUF4118 domain-containing protein [Stellaceae bacterium]
MNQGAHFSDLMSRLAVTALAVVLAITIEGLLETVKVSTPYLVFLPVVTGICALSGFGMGLCAILFSALGLWYFFIPPHGFDLPSPADFMHLCVFVTVAFFGCWIIDGLKRANDELSRDNFVLGCKISMLLSRKKPQ